MKFILVALLALSTMASVTAHASTINPTGQVIPQDPQLAFMASAGGQTLVNAVFIRLLSRSIPIMGKWYVEIPLCAAEAYGVGYLLQSSDGALQTKENDQNKANCSAIAGVATAAFCWALSVDFGLGGCK